MYPIFLLPLAFVAYFLLQPRRRQITTTTTPTSPTPQTPIQYPTKTPSTPKSMPDVGKMPDPLPPLTQPLGQPMTSKPPTQQTPIIPTSVNALSQHGLQFIRAQESFSPTAYNDPPGSQTWSIGYGHQIVSGDGLSRSSHVTQAQAEQLLARDVAGFVATILQSVRVPLNQGQFDALVSLAYNIGGTNFRSSTLLQKLNARDYAGASREFSRWIYGNGRVIQALVSRRGAEASMFNGAMV